MWQARGAVGLYAGRMAAAEQSTEEPRRDYASPATWGDVEQVRHALSLQIAQLESATTARIAELESATTARIAELESATTTRIAELESATQVQIAEVKADIAQLDARTEKRITEVKAEIAGQETRLLRWMAATGGAGVAFLSLLIALLEVFR